MRKVEFIDTTLRDGQQSPLLFDTYKYRFSLEEKKQIIEALVKLGVRYFEMFSPIVGSGERDEFIELRNYAKNISSGEVKLLCHCRVNVVDIQNALDFGFDGLNLFFGTSKHSQGSVHGKSLNHVVDVSTNIIKTLREQHPDMYIRFSGEDAFRTDLDDLFKVYDPLVSYVDTFGMPDTVGTASPGKVLEVTRELTNRYPDTNFECHFHNDRGYSLVNTVTAVTNGVKYVDSAIWGLSERSGISSITGTLLNLYLEDKNYVDGYDISLSYPVNILMASILKTHVPPSEPVSITNRTHIAGVHQKSAIGNNCGYEATNLEKFGVNTQQIILGPLSGWNQIHYYINEVLEYNSSEERSKEITAIFKNQTHRINTDFKPEVLLKEIVIEYGLHQVERPADQINRRFENLKSND